MVTLTRPGGAAERRTREPAVNRAESVCDKDREEYVIASVTTVGSRPAAVTKA